MSAVRKRRLPPIHAQALNILKAYGANAHLYLPGVGAINGITAGNWQDSAGTIAATVDNPIGLIQDSIGGIHASQATTAAKPILRQVPTKLGAELITSQNLTTWTSGGAFGNWTGTTATATTATALAAYGARTLRLPCAPGRSYSFSAAISGNLSQIGISFGTSGAVLIAANTSATSTASGVLRMDAMSPVNAAFVEFSVLVVTSGQTATFTSLTAGEGLEVTYSAQFDGVDDCLSLGAVPFQMADDHCVVAGASNSVSGNSVIFVGGTGASNAAYGVLGIYAGKLKAAWIGDGYSPIQEIVESGSTTTNTPVVGSLRKISSALVLRKNGVVSGTLTNAGGTYTSTTSQIGFGYFGQYFSGQIYPVIAIKGTVSDADLLTLEKFVGSLSGVTL